MAEIFNSLAEFKAHVGGAINQTIELDSLAPVIADTARRHLVPYLSQEFYLVVAQAAGAPDPEYVALLPYVRRALALLTMHEYAKIAGVEFGESGIYRIETETRKSAYRYQEKQYSEYMLEKGYDALEEMLIFLEKNLVDYEDWALSNEALAHFGLLLNYAKDMRMLINVQCDRYTFDTLKPIILEVQEFGVERLLPVAFWGQFLGAYQSDNLQPQETKLLAMIRASIAHRTYEEAARRGIITTKSGRIFLQEEGGDQNQVNRTMPTGTLIGSHMIAHDIWSDRHVARWKQFILDNPTDFSLVFDEASGGTNTDDDAWHINTDDEQALADQAAVDRNDRPIFQL